MGKVFEGLKVVDLTTALNGPFCTMFLGDYGADVIKIEPVGGEQSRSWGPIDEKSGESGILHHRVHLDAQARLAYARVEADPRPGARPALQAADRAVQPHRRPQGTAQPGGRAA